MRKLIVCALATVVSVTAWAGSGAVDGRYDFAPESIIMDPVSLALSAGAVDSEVAQAIEDARQDRFPTTTFRAVALHAMPGLFNEPTAKLVRYRRYVVDHAQSFFLPAGGVDVLCAMSGKAGYGRMLRSCDMPGVTQGASREAAERIDGGDTDRGGAATVAYFRRPILLADTGTVKFCHAAGARLNCIEFDNVNTKQNNIETLTSLPLHNNAAADAMYMWGYEGRLLDGKPVYGTDGTVTVRAHATALRVFDAVHKSELFSVRLPDTGGVRIAELGDAEFARMVAGK